MPPSEKYNVRIGSVSHSQVSIGDYNRLVALTPDESAELRDLFGEFRTSVAESVAPDRRDEALAQADELERAVVSAAPDAGRARRALRWFRDNLPHVAATAVSVLVDPLVGKLVDAAGTAVADPFRATVEGR